MSVSTPQIVHEICCGLDVHKSSVYGCIIATDKNTLEGIVHRAKFDTFGEGLENLAAWLQKFSCTDVCMESTGKYWLPIYNVLEKHGLHPVLTHPKYTKPMTGKKTDKRDAQHIAEMFRIDMVEGSYIPEKDIRELRDLLRYRAKIVNANTAEKNRFRNCLTVANIKLDDVFSDVFGKSSMAIIKNLMAHPDGDFDVSLFLEKKGTRKASAEQIQSAIKDNTLDKVILSKMKLLLRRIERNEEDIAYLDECIDELSEKFNPQLDLLQTIPGVKKHTALVILAEIGPDMSVFRKPKAFVSWAGLVPQNNESGGKKKTTRISHGGLNLKPTLIQWALAIAKSTSHPEMTSFYKRIASRHGSKKAAIALCRKLMLTVFMMLSDMTPYNPEKFSAYKEPEETTSSFDKKLTKAIKVCAAAGLCVADVDGVVIDPDNPFVCASEEDEVIIDDDDDDDDPVVF